jgi:hypothetical protein
MKSIILIPIALLFLIGCDEVKEVTYIRHEVDTYDKGDRRLMK